MSKKPGVNYEDVDSLNAEQQRALLALEDYLANYMPSAEEAHSEFLASNRFPPSLFRRLARWGLVGYRVDGGGPHISLLEKGRAWVAILELRMQHLQELFPLLTMTETGRTTSSKPNIQGLPTRGR